MAGCGTRRVVMGEHVAGRRFPAAQTPFAGVEPVPAPDPLHNWGR